MSKGRTERPVRHANPWAALPQLVRDVLTGVLLLVLGITPQLYLTPDLPAWIPILYAVAAIAVVVLRRRFDYLALAVGCVPLLLIAVLDNPGPGLILPATVALFMITNHRGLRIGLLCLAAVAVVIMLAALGSASIAWLSRQPLAMSAVLVAAVALGETSRARRAYIDQITDRAERAEATRESEARRRVAEDRLRIAQDLHDVVAHQIAVINLQAAVASSSLRRDPEATEAALGVIHDAARSVLNDIGGLLAMLRNEDQDSATREVEPVVSLSRLADLVDQFRRTGLEIELSDRLSVPLPTVVDLVAYRVIQEALTNAHKYGTGTARLSLEASTALTITVENPTNRPAGAAPSVAGSGLGLQGIRERVAAVHGTAVVREDGPTFLLTVTIPLTPTDEPGQPSDAVRNQS